MFIHVDIPQNQFENDLPPENISEFDILRCANDLLEQGYVQKIY